MYHTIINNTIQQFKSFISENYGHDSINTIYMKFQVQFSLEQLLQHNHSDDWETLAKSWLETSINTYSIIGEQGLPKLAN